MDLKKALAMLIAAGAAVAAFALPAGAHGTPGACVLAASPALVNNIEMGPPSNSSDPMSGATAGHAGQVKVDGRYGLYYPVTDPVQAHWTGTENQPGYGTGLVPAFRGDLFNWKQQGSCAHIVSQPYSASGSGIGYCGRSVGTGTGSITVSGVTHATTIKWESVGSQLILTHGSAVGSVNAQANPPGSPAGSCLNGGAVVFIVDGALAHA